MAPEIRTSPDITAYINAAYSKSELQKVIGETDSKILSWLKYKFLIGIGFQNSNPQKFADTLFKKITAEGGEFDSHILRHASHSVLLALSKKFETPQLDKKTIDTIFKKAIRCSTKDEQKVSIAKVALAAIHSYKDENQAIELPTINTQPKNIPPEEEETPDEKKASETSIQQVLDNLEERNKLLESLKTKKDNEADPINKMRNSLEQQKRQSVTHTQTNIKKNIY